MIFFCLNLNAEIHIRRVLLFNTQLFDNTDTVRAGVSARPHTSRTVQPQNMVRGLNFLN